LVVFETTLLIKPPPLAGVSDYLFTNVTVGMFYIITAEREKYSFVPPQQAINLLGDETGLNFRAVQNEIKPTRE